VSACLRSIPGEPTREAIPELVAAAMARGDAHRAKMDEMGTLWWDLVEGRRRLVAHFERGSRRYYVTMNVDDGASGLTRLDAGERRVAEMLGRGESEKAAAYALGVSPAKVSHMLKAILHKLGLRSRVELVLLACWTVEEGMRAPSPGEAR
jgi:DNA-binding NarL/FixJ family response regulator